MSDIGQLQILWDHCISNKVSFLKYDFISEKKIDIQARPYHANLAADRRTLVHKKWLKGSIQVVVATVAFGMGIDKVWHKELD